MKAPANVSKVWCYHMVALKAVSDDITNFNPKEFAVTSVLSRKNTLNATLSEAQYCSRLCKWL